jgi:hypothetical protein
VNSKAPLGGTRKLWTHIWGDLEGFLCICYATRPTDKKSGAPTNSELPMKNMWFPYTPKGVDDALAFIDYFNNTPMGEVFFCRNLFPEAGGETWGRTNGRVEYSTVIALELDGPPIPSGELAPMASVLSSPMVDPQKEPLGDDKDHYHVYLRLPRAVSGEHSGELGAAVKKYLYENLPEEEKAGKSIGDLYGKSEPSSLLRPPGTRNWKYIEPVYVELHEIHEDRRVDVLTLESLPTYKRKREKGKHTGSSSASQVGTATPGEPPVPLSGYALEVWEGKHRVQGDDGDCRYRSLFHILATTCEVLARSPGGMNPDYARSVLIDAARDRDHAIDWRDEMGEYKGLKTEKRDADVYYEKLADEVIEKKIGEGEFMKSESNGNGPVGNEAGSLASLEVPPSPNGSGDKGSSPGGRGVAVKPTDGEPDIEEIRKLFWTPKDVYERAGEKDTPVVPGFLYEGFMVDLAGEAGSGKTTFLMAMVKAILTGGYFLGRPCQRSPVVYLSEQAETIVTAMEKIGLNPEHEGLYVLPHKNVDDLTWEETYTRVRRMAKGVGAKAIFTDTIDDFGGLESDQSSNDGDVRKLLKLPKAAAQVDGLAVLNVRQMNKMGKGKGSVEFDHSPDIVRGLYILPNGPENAREIRTIKSRTREELPRKQTVELREGIYHSLGSATKIQEQHARNAALSILKKQEHTRIRKSTLVERVTSEAQVSEATAKRALSKMEEDREIRVETVKGKGNPQVCVLISEETLLPNPLRIPDEDVL